MKRIFVILSIAFSLAFIASCNHNDNVFEPKSNSPQDLAYTKTLDSISWPSGMYIWKVISNGKPAESGKWLKSH